MNGYKINDNLYINCNNIDYISFSNNKPKIHMSDNNSYYITQDQYADIETKISQSGGSGGGADITANILVTANKGDIIGSTTEKNKLCILNDTSDLSFKVVDKIEGGEKVSTLSEVLPQVLGYACCASYGDNFYIFGGRNSSNFIDTIYKFNCTNKTITTLSTTLPQVLGYACCASYGDNIYIFGGYNNSSDQLKTIYKFNCSNEIIETLSITLPNRLSDACCVTYGDNIYIIGGYNGSSISNIIYKFNCTNNTITTLSTTLRESARYHCCSIFEDNIYIFGGYKGNGYITTIYKYNITNNLISNVSNLPNYLQNSCCATFEDNIYIFGGYVSGNGYIDTIYKFNCTNNTIETLSNTLPNKLSNACCSIYNDNIYIFGGFNGTSNNYSNTIYKFSVFFELIANNVLLYCANSNYSFDLITDQVTIPIKNVYIGDSNNTAQLANAYLYDESQTAWVNVNTGEVLS